MSRELERQTITAHFDSVWLPTDGPIAWPNQEFLTPNNSGFCVFSLVDMPTFRRSLGTTFSKRYSGVLQVDIYTPQNKGTKRGKMVSDRLEDIYEMLVLHMSNGQAVEFGTPTSRVLDPNVIRASNLDDNWDRYVFEAPYHRDVIVVK